MSVLALLQTGINTLNKVTEQKSNLDQSYIKNEWYQWYDFAAE